VDILVNNVLDDYATPVDTRKLILSQIRQKIQVQKNPKSYSFDIHWGETNRLDMIREYDADLKFPEVTI
jgi:hypothetical protein